MKDLTLRLLRENLKWCFRPKPVAELSPNRPFRRPTNVNKPDQEGFGFSVTSDASRAIAPARPSDVLVLKINSVTPTASHSACKPSEMNPEPPASVELAFLGFTDV